MEKPSISVEAMKVAMREVLFRLPAHVHVYDNGGKTADRYTVYIREREDADFDCYTMSVNAFSPAGINQFSHSVAMPQDDAHVGERKLGWGEVPFEVAAAIVYRLDVIPF